MRWYRGYESQVEEDALLAARTAYKVGGPARWYVQPHDETTLAALLRRAADRRLPVHVLGGGTNLLVADGGVDGAVIRLPLRGFARIERQGTRLTVGAGFSLPRLVKWSLAQGLAGLECLVGVPGSVGAALRMNAGGKYGELGARVVSVRGVEWDGTPFRFNRDACGFRYRDSDLKDRLVTACELDLEPAEPPHGEALVRRIIAEKRASQPLDRRSAGCVFKNPKLPGVPPAGKMIDELGLKGLRVGGASVSTLHANFVVTDRWATATDVLGLIRHIRRHVYRERGVQLDLEIATWGVRQEELAV
ncbi:MAG: UDP-N-acetylmuramate dehydrogenase [Planctomycetota bacterium]|nr:UDP-N-acetylmuramate dehydrogenase [Planctomycetota bacterium]